MQAGPVGQGTGGLVWAMARKGTNYGGGTLGKPRNRAGLSYDLSGMQLKLRLKVDASKLIKNVGRKVATKVKRAWKGGLNFDGSTMDPVLRDTGELSRSVRFLKSGAVGPSTRKRSDVGASAKSNFGLLSIHLHRADAAGRSLDPMGYTAPEEQGSLVNTLGETEVDRQLKKGDARLVNELRSAARRARFTR